MPNSRLSTLQIVLIALVLAAGFVGGGWFAWERWVKERPVELVAEVGDYGITKEQLALRQQHANVYYPGSGTPEVALAQLIQGYLAAMLMKGQNVELDRATWIAEEKRIDKQTRDPATLAKVKFVYGDNHEDYLYVGILPDFAQSRIYKLYRSSSSFAEEARKKASAFLDVADANPDRFEELAKEHGALHRKLLVDAEEGLQPIAEKEEGPTDPSFRDESPKSAQEMRLRAEMKERATQQETEAARSLLAKLQGLPEGGIYRNTLEAPESFEAVRLVSRKPDGSAVVEMATFVKPDFGKWFWEEAGKIPVKIHIPGLREALVSDVSWAKHLNLY